jgi:glycosyltransferase involved in cell wall biosynthesis
LSVSVAILTLNEEHNLPDCLASLAGRSDDVLVFDSFSTDDTCEIAARSGARVLQRRFDNYAEQRNAALASDFRHPWVLMLDADERLTRELWEEMLAAIAQAPADAALFRMRRKDMFLGRWLRRSSGYPTWFGRLMRRGRVRVMRDVNEEYLAEGRVGYLQGHLMHFPFRRGVAHWIDRHNAYSTMEAARLVQERREPMRIGDVLSVDPVRRRRGFKQLGYRLPMRPTAVFLYLYLFRFGLLDGRAGYWYCRLRAAYELFIDIKARELIEGTQ